jgi:hypothetical protein
MTSWNRGKENEEEGEAKMDHGQLGDKIAGAGQKIAGEVEQGLDNVGDTVSGRQRDIQGDDMGNAADRAGDWAQNRGDDARDAADRAGDWVQNRAEDVDRKVD